MDNIRVEVEDDVHEDDVQWRICCSHSSKSFIKYVVTVIMSIIVLVFSIYMIATNPENDNSIYFSLLSTIIGMYMPQPTLDKLIK
jgi:NADH:ubiquinone oxidoreductase subunit 2 (subunit N)